VLEVHLQITPVLHNSVVVVAVTAFALAAAEAAHSNSTNSLVYSLSLQTGVPSFDSSYYLRMLIGKVWIYCLLFVCLYDYGFLRRQILHGGSSASKAGNVQFV